jgi:hypothetical protein
VGDQGRAGQGRSSSGGGPDRGQNAGRAPGLDELGAALEARVQDRHPDLRGLRRGGGTIACIEDPVVAALATFVAGRLVRRDTVRRLAGRKLDRLSTVLRQRGLLAMTAVRLGPLAPFPVVGLVAGAIRVKLWHYALGTFLGNLPGVLAATVFAAEIAAALEDPSRINWWVIGGVVAVLVVGTAAVRRWLGKTIVAQPAVPAGAR